MRKVEHNSLRLWLGFHPKLGPVIYDANSQGNLSDAEVRLFKIDEQRAGTFQKAVVKSTLVEVDDAIWRQAQSAIAKYSSMITNRRVTHCFSCRQRLDSTEFSVCPTCNWLKCGCGACGCSFGKGVDSDTLGRSNVLASSSTEEWRSSDDVNPDSDARKDAEFESDQIRDEASDYSTSLARSDDEGWFYSDDDPE